MAFEGLLAAALGGEPTPEAEATMPDGAVEAVAGAAVAAPPPPASVPPILPSQLVPTGETAEPVASETFLKTPEAPVMPVREVSSPVMKLPEPIPEDAPAEEAPVAANDAGIVAAPAVAQQMPAPPPSGTGQATANDAAVAAALSVLKALDGEADQTASADHDDTIVARAAEAADMASKGQARPAAEPPPQTPPPAQRQLTERTVRQHGDTSNAERARTDETAPVKSAVAGSAPMPAATPSAPESGPKVDAAPVLVADAASPDTGDLPVEGQSAETAQQSVATTTAREALSPALSRTAIEATVQIAAQIQRRLEGRNTRFEIALTPDNLGRVDVRLDIDAEGRLAARLAFDNPAAAADLRGRADELRRQLEQFGFQLADDAFEFAERDSGSSAFDRGQDARDGQNRAFARARRLNMDTDSAALTPRWTNLSLTPSGVDLKV